MERPRGERWISTHPTQEEAETAAKNYARDHGGGEVFVHRDEGEFSRIRKGDAV